MQIRRTRVFGAPGARERMGRLCPGHQPPSGNARCLRALVALGSVLCLPLFAGAAAPRGPTVLSAADETGQLAPRPLFRIVRITAAGTILKVDNAAREGFLALEGVAVIADLPLPTGETVTLELERFRVVSPRARFVVARSGEPDAPLDFDPDSIVFLRGRVAGLAGSHVFLSLGDESDIGRIELGPGRETFVLTSAGVTGLNPGRGELALIRGSGGVGALAPGPLCDVADTGGDPPGGGPGPDPVRGLRQVELAVDADYELRSLFRHPPQAAAYLVQMYGAVSDIIMRDTLNRLDIVYLRIWETPDDPWGNSTGMPQIPSGVQYDAAQMVSGRKDASAGGLASVCGSRSWIAYTLGFFVTLDRPHIYSQDIRIAAHELGHNLGASHTHAINPPIDRCDNATTPPRRGTIMSYCSQTFSGGTALTDLRFHTGIQPLIERCVRRRRNMVYDCNQNAVDDELDIRNGFSPDVNNNLIPDECEDCNANGVLDDEDIRSGTSLDLNGNRIPDECEPDCNGNAVPDDLDIASGFSDDLHGNGVPDECEADCNLNGESDYNEILADMSLDIDRDAVLDACQDCDNDGIPDLAALEGAHNLWAASFGDGSIREFHATVGVLMNTSDPTRVSEAQDLLISPDGRILVSSSGDDRIVEFDRTGGYVRDFVQPGAGGLDYPTFMTFAPDGRLLVASRDTHAVLRYDGASGAFLGPFVASRSGGLVNPYGLAFGPTGGLFVIGGDGQMIEYDGETGAFVRVFISGNTDDNSGLIEPRGILFTPDGERLLVASGNNAILEYDARTGAFRGQFNNGDYRGRLVHPWGLRIGPSGHVYVSSARYREAAAPAGLHLTDPRIFEFDVRNGNLMRAYIQGPDSELLQPSGFDFMPGDDTDCNFNQLPDSCDIRSGRSRDLNGNGRPDECEARPGDMNCDGSLNGADIDPFFLALGDPTAYAARFPDCLITNGDLNCDGQINGDDIDPFVRRLVRGMRDCNANGIADDCEGLETLAIRAQPEGVEVCAGERVVLTVETNRQPLSYQWRKDGVAIPGANFNPLVFSSAQPPDSGEYDVLVADACVTRLSDAANLVVNDPVVLRHPRSQDLCAGNELVLSVETAGADPGFQWRKDGRSIPGATQATYEIKAVTPADAGLYNVDISNYCGRARSRSARGTVEDIIYADPESQTVCENDPVILFVGALGTSLEYQWRKDGVEIAGATSNLFIIGAARLKDGGVYDVVVTSAECTQESDPATLTVRECP